MPPAAAAATPAPTAQSILTALLLTPTTFLLPSLSSLRQLLHNTSPSLSSATDDKTLKQYLRDLQRQRASIDDGVEEAIAGFRLGRSAAGAGGTGGEEGEGEEEEVEELELADAVERLEEEERRLVGEVEAVESALEGCRARLDASVEMMEKIPRLPVPPSVKREVEESLGGLERDVKRFRGQVDGIGRRAARAET